MVGVILEVMTDEHRSQTSDQASHERHDMKVQLDRMQRQLDKMHVLLRQRV